MPGTACTLGYMSSSELSYELIDAHCHLDFEVFDADRTQVLERAASTGISDIIIPGTERCYWDRINTLCSGNKQLHLVPFYRQRPSHFHDLHTVGCMGGDTCRGSQRYLHASALWAI